MRGHQVRSYGPGVTTEERPANPTRAPSPGHRHLQGYEIRVKGHLGARWAAWFDGLSVTNEDDGTTVIAGPPLDQAALHGLLQKLRDLGVPLVSLNQLPPEDPTTATRAPTAHRNPRGT
jgi:hypothetical protein